VDKCRPGGGARVATAAERAPAAPGDAPLACAAAVPDLANAAAVYVERHLAFPSCEGYPQPPANASASAAGAAFFFDTTPVYATGSGSAPAAPGSADGVRPPMLEAMRAVLGTETPIVLLLRDPVERYVERGCCCCCYY
jgi:hypothetical protein